MERIEGQMGGGNPSKTKTTFGQYDFDDNGWNNILLQNWISLRREQVLESTQKGLQR